MGLSKGARNSREIYQINRKNVYRLQSIHKNGSIRRRISNRERGAARGSFLSPNLFNSALQEVFNQLNWENKGIKINGERLNNLRFAGDVLIAGSKEEIEEMGNEFIEASKKAGLKANMLKTKMISNAPEEPIRIEGEGIEWGKEVIYLGQRVSFEDRRRKEISTRIKKGRGVFGN